jgi:hypothetical protein
VPSSPVHVGKQRGVFIERNRNDASIIRYLSLSPAVLIVDRRLDYFCILSCCDCLAHRMRVSDNTTSIYPQLVKNDWSNYEAANPTGGCSKYGTKPDWQPLQLTRASFFLLFSTSSLAGMMTEHTRYFFQQLLPQGWPTCGNPNEENTELVLLVPLLPALPSLIRSCARLSLLPLPPRPSSVFSGASGGKLRRLCVSPRSRIFSAEISWFFLRAFSAALFRIWTSRHATGSVAAWIRSD